MEKAAMLLLLFAEPENQEQEIIQLRLLLQRGTKGFMRR